MWELQGLRADVGHELKDGVRMRDLPVAGPGLRGGRGSGPLEAGCFSCLGHAGVCALTWQALPRHFIAHQIITLHHTSNQHTHHTSSRFPTLPANTHCDVRSLAGFGALPQRSMSWASRLAELDPFFLSSNELGCLEGVGSLGLNVFWV